MKRQELEEIVSKSICKHVEKIDCTAGSKLVSVFFRPYTEVSEYDMRNLRLAIIDSTGYGVSGAWENDYDVPCVRLYTKLSFLLASPLEAEPVEKEVEL